MPKTPSVTWEPAPMTSPSSLPVFLILRLPRARLSVVWEQPPQVRTEIFPPTEVPVLLPSIEPFVVDSVHVAIREPVVVLRVADVFALRVEWISVPTPYLTVPAASVDSVVAEAVP